MSKAFLRSEHILANASTLWMSAPLEGKRALQAALFPEGIAWNGERFGTALTCGAFSYLQEISSASEGMASLTGFEPVLPP